MSFFVKVEGVICNVRHLVMRLHWRLTWVPKRTGCCATKVTEYAGRRQEAVGCYLSR